MNKHLNFCSMRLAQGRSKIAHQVEVFSTLIPLRDEWVQRLELAERSEFQVALDGDVARRVQEISTESDAFVSS